VFSALDVVQATMCNAYLTLTLTLQHIMCRVIHYNMLVIWRVYHSCRFYLLCIRCALVDIL